MEFIISIPTVPSTKICNHKMFMKPVQDGAQENGFFAANGHMLQNHHAGEQAMHWDIQNKENLSLTG